MNTENLPARARTVRQAIDLLDSTGWCQNALARDKDGEQVTVLSEEACWFCLTGAVMRSCWVDEESATEAWENDFYNASLEEEEDSVVTCYQVLFDLEDTVCKEHFKIGRTRLDTFNDYWAVDYGRVRDVLVKTAERLEAAMAQEVS